MIFIAQLQKAAFESVDTNKFVKLLVFCTCLVWVCSLLFLFDKDGNDFIATNELHSALLGMGDEAHSLEDCHRMISSFDKDSDDLSITKSFGPCWVCADLQNREKN